MNFVELQEDVFLLIICQLNLKDLFSLKVVSKVLAKKILLLELRTANFWENIARTKFEPERLEEVIDYKQLLFNHHNLEAIIRKEIQNNNKYFMINILSLIDDNYLMGDIDWSWFFSLKNLCQALKEDRAEKLFKIITPIHKIAACLGQNYLSFKEIEQMIKDNLAKIADFEGVNVNSEHLYFISVIPFVIKARATRCFEIIVRAYFYLAMYFPKEDLEENRLLLPKAFLDLVFLGNDNYFKKKLAHIVLQIIPTKRHILFEVLDYFHKNNAIDLLTLAMQGVNKRKLIELNQQLERWPVTNNLRRALFPNPCETMELIAELRQCFVVGDAYLKNNAQVTIQVLESMKQNLNEAIDKLKEHLGKEDLDVSYIDLNLSML